MALRIVVHLMGEDAFLGEVDELPNPNHAYVLMRNLLRRDGKELTYVTDGATAFLFPWHRISFLEMMDEVPTGTLATVGAAPATEILGFFREDKDR